ncbi:MAG TPA: helix-turn-helix transcriptional regulator [Cellulomonas sp.]
MASSPQLPRKKVAVKQYRAALGYIAYQIGNLVSVERNRRGLTQEEIGVRVGIDQPYISSIENGISVPASVKNDQIDALFRALGLGDAQLHANFVKCWRDNG